MAEFSHGCWLSQSFSEMKSTVWGFGVLRSGGYFVLFHSFIGGCRIGLDAVWIEIKSLFFGFVFLVWTVDLEDFQAQLAGFSLPYIFML